MSQELRDALFIAEDYRANFKNVIAKRSDQVVFMGGRMKPAASAGTYVAYQAGLVVGYASSGADAGYYKPYASTATDGSEVAVGVLSEYTEVDHSDNGGAAPIITRGILFKDLLIGLDSTAISALGGKTIVEHGVNLISIYA